MTQGLQHRGHQVGTASYGFGEKNVRLSLSTQLCSRLDQIVEFAAKARSGHFTNLKPLCPQGVGVDEAVCLVVGDDAHPFPQVSIMFGEPGNDSRLASPEETTDHQQTRLRHGKLLVPEQPFVSAPSYPLSSFRTSGMTPSNPAGPTVEGSPFPWPRADEEVQHALEEAYRTGSWGRYWGPNCDQLVEALCRRFRRDHAMLCASGTIAVELALRGCGVGPGDEVILAGYDFPGNFRAIEAVGARPLLVDVDRQRWCLDVEQLASVTSQRVTAVIVSHLHGGLADMEKLVALSRNRGWHVVEDACQQPGATLAGRPVGSWGDVGVFSFGGSKLLTAGRGGAVVTDDPAVHQRMKIFAERGNQVFPLSELQAAVVLPQLKKLDRHNALRSERIEIIRQGTCDLQQWLRPVTNSHEGQPAYYKFAWSFVPAESDPHLRDQVLGLLQSRGVPVDAGFRGFVGRSERRCSKHGSLQESQGLSQSTVLLHHPVLLANENAAHQVAKVLSHETRYLTT